MIRKAIIVVMTLLAAAAGAAWVWAAAGGRSVTLLSQSSDTWTLNCSLESLHKRLRVVHWRFPKRRADELIINLDETPSATSRTEFWSPLGFSYTRHRAVLTNGPVSVVRIVLPLWEPLVIFGLYPAIAFIRGPLRRYRRRRRGLCIRCGYDLEGNVSGACPECGRTMRG